LSAVGSKALGTGAWCSRKAPRSGSEWSSRPHPPGQFQAVQERQRAENAEGAIDQAPVERDAADFPGDEREGNHADAAHETALQHPVRFERFEKRADKKHRDAKMPERQPVGAVREKGKMFLVLFQREKHPRDPMLQSAQLRKICGVGDTQPRGEEPEFGEERKGGDAAQNQSDDEETKCEAVADEGHITRRLSVHELRPDREFSRPPLARVGDVRRRWR